MIPVNSDNNLSFDLTIDNNKPSVIYNNLVISLFDSIGASL